MLKEIDHVYSRPSYIEKLRVYFKAMLPNMLKNYQRSKEGQKGCWVTTILPSLLDRQIRMSSGNLAMTSMIESEFVPISKIENNDLRKFLEEFEIKDSLPLVIINSVSTVDGYHMVIISNNNQKVYSLDSL